MTRPTDNYQGLWPCKCVHFIYILHFECQRNAGKTKCKDKEDCSCFRIMIRIDWFECTFRYIKASKKHQWFFSGIIFKLVPLLLDPLSFLFICFSKPLTQSFNFPRFRIFVLAPFFFNSFRKLHCVLLEVKRIDSDIIKHTTTTKSERLLFSLCRPNEKKWIA